MPGIIAKTKNNSYPIYIDPSALLDFHEFIKDKKYSNCAVLVDKKLSKHLSRILKIIRFQFPSPLIINLTANENLKQFENIYPLYNKLITAGFDRKSVIVSVGGGTIGDTAGFLASTYLRGVDWVNIPTTLLSQVDSSVGGKTGINYKHFKNMIGTFYQPKAVFIEPQFLKTLSQREMVSGLGETIKYGLIFDRYFFYEFFNSYDKALNYDIPTLLEFISRSVRWKAQVVSTDEMDKTGQRALLNFGHTLGHALEAYYNYKKLNHGEAVVWGMKFATIMSYLKNMISLRDMTDVITGLDQLPIPQLEKIEFEKLWKIVIADKKTENKIVKMVLLKGIGRAISNQEITKMEFKSAFKILRELK